jgi:general nucleoside transport system permease protein
VRPSPDGTGQLIGGTGQVLMGGFVAAIVGGQVASQPAFVAVPVAVAAGALAGFAYGFIPGFLKAYTGAHEVVTTIMLNSIAVALISGLVNDVLKITGPTFARTADVGAAALPKITGTLHAGFLIALVLIPLTWYLLFRTTRGFEIRTVGANPNAARYAGMSAGGSMILAMALSGGLAGFGGSFMVLGTVGQLSLDLSGGIRFTAIAPERAEWLGGGVGAGAGSPGYGWHRWRC